MQCRRLPRNVDETALRKGFDAPGMLTAFQASPPTITWVPPGGALYVACAVFRCTPSFGVLPAAQSATATGLAYISNFDACALLFYVEDAGDASVRVGFANQRARAAPCTSDAPPLRESIEHLSYGCWAYDGTSVVAASKLLPLQPIDLAGVIPTLPLDATCARNGADCYDVENGYFGLCADDACRPRCELAEDCEVQATLSGQPSRDTCAWRCADVADSDVGVCEPIL